MPVACFLLLKGARPNISIASGPLRGLFLSTWKIKVCFEAAVNSKGECFCQTLKFSEIMLFKSVRCPQKHDRVFLEGAVSERLETTCKCALENLAMFDVSYPAALIIILKDLSPGPFSSILSLIPIITKINTLEIKMFTEVTSFLFCFFICKQKHIYFPSPKTSFKNKIIQQT